MLDVPNFGLWLIRKLKLHNHTLLAEHPMSTFVPVFHGLSETQATLGHVLLPINFPRKFQARRSQPKRWGEKNFLNKGKIF